MKKASKLKDAKRFGWYSPDFKIRLWLKDDGSGGKVTMCQDLTSEQMVEAAKWLTKVARDLKKIREDGWTNATGRAFDRKP